MDCIVNSNRVTLGNGNFLGEGGEATVYRIGNYAVKILKTAALAKMPKVEAMIGIQYPKHVLGPLSIVRDLNGKRIGFTTEYGDGQELNLLSRPRWREKNGVSLNFVQELFTSFSVTLKQLHDLNMIIGDLNYNNILFGTYQGSHSVLDVDSMSIKVGSKDYPCTAMHPWFFDPMLTELIGEFKRTALTPGAAISIHGIPKFTELTDWYSFTVCLFMSLFCIHPFKGGHKTLNTEFDRMLARYSVFKSDVVYPRNLIPLDNLNQDLAHHFVKVFEQDYRPSEFPVKLFTPWAKCTSCNTEYNRKVCPTCQSGVTARTAVVISGRCRADTILTTDSVLEACYQDRLRYVYFEGDTFYRDTYDKMGRPLCKGKLNTNMRFVLQLDRTWIGNNTTGSLIPLDVSGVNQTLQTTSGKMGKGVMFDCNSTSTYMMYGDSIVRWDGSTIKLIGQMIENRTWFKVGEKYSIGFYKIGRGVFYCMWDEDTRIAKPLQNIPNPKGKLLDMTAYFGNGVILIALSSEFNGQIWNEMHLIDVMNYTVLGSIVGENTTRMLSTIYGKALIGNKRILMSTDDGILTCEIVNREIVERTILADTEKFVSAGDQLFLHSSNQIYVVGKQTITLLTL